MTRQYVVPGTRTAFDSSFLIPRRARSSRASSTDRRLARHARKVVSTVYRDDRATNASCGRDCIRDSHSMHSMEMTSFATGSRVARSRLRAGASSSSSSSSRGVVARARARMGGEGEEEEDDARSPRWRRSATVDGALGARARVDGTFGATTTRTRGGWGCGDAGERRRRRETLASRAARGTRGRETRRRERRRRERRRREREGQGRGEGVSRAFEHRHGGERVRAVQ